MVSKRYKTSPVIIAFVPAILVIIAVAVINVVYAPQLAKYSSLVTPADLRAREIFRSNWQTIMAQNKASKVAAQVPVTGSVSDLHAGMSQRAMDAYSARMNGLANQQYAASRRAMDAYSARMNGLASQQQGMSQRALAAYSARWEAMASSYQALLRKSK